MIGDRKMRAKRFAKISKLRLDVFASILVKALRSSKDDRSAIFTKALLNSASELVERMENDE